MRVSALFFHLLGLCLVGGFLDLDAQEISRPLPSAVTNVPAAAAIETPAATAAQTTLGEAGLLRLLTEKLQADCVKDRGELELRFARPWRAVPAPDDSLSLKILELPNSGVSPQFIVKFEILTPDGTLGTWQAVLQAKVWREILVARVPLLRGQLLDPADLAIERRDVLPIRGEFAQPTPGEIRQELAENLPAGSPILTRALRIRPVVRRGQTVEALISEGSMQITMKVEVLEDGIPGQAVRLRNLQSRRELRGVVQNETRILIPL